MAITGIAPSADLEIEDFGEGNANQNQERPFSD
jgi:hypothetical protein